MELEHFYNPGPGSRLKLAHAYVPFQQYTERYSLEEALQRGTLYPELYMPYEPGYNGYY